MTYVLNGREAANDPASGEPAGPCSFCGRHVVHFNGGGVGWLLGAVVDGAARWFLYCDQPPCPEAIANAADIWRCGCTADYVENVGAVCHACGRVREAARPFPRTDTLHGGSE